MNNDGPEREAVSAERRRKELHAYALHAHAPSGAEVQREHPWCAERREKRLAQRPERSGEQAGREMAGECNPPEPVEMHKRGVTQ